MISRSLPSVRSRAPICSNCWTIASAPVPPSSPANYPSSIGTNTSATQACDINNPKRAVNYLATVAHESGQLRYMAEIWGPNQVPEQKTYRNRMGNDKPEAIALAHAAGFSDPGQAFKGYGPIQVTGFDNQTEIADNFSIPHEN